VGETEKLLLREFNLSDAANLYELNRDLEVTKYTGNHPFESIAEAEGFIKTYYHYAQYGFGRWAVIDKSNDEFLGWCGLKYTEDLDEYDVGFRFFKKYWNRGIATESAKACLDLGFTKFGMTTIVGRAMKENPASIRVLEKIGMTLNECRIRDNSAWLIYKIDKNN
jgi:[ribosomal protein S5]-alanine N-acetyltransferase